MSESKELHRAIDDLGKKPCACVPCSNCDGTGNVRVDFITGLPTQGCDDLDELEPCDECRGGIIETCQRCSEMEELYELIEENEYRSSRQGPQ